MRKAPKYAPVTDDRDVELVEAGGASSSSCGDETEAQLNPLSQESPPEEDRGPMLNLRCLDLKGRTFKLHLPESTTIRELKAVLERDSGVPAGKQRLIAAGRQLGDDDQTLSGASLKEGTAFHLFARPDAAPPEAVAVATANPAPPGAPASSVPVASLSPGAVASSLGGVSVLNLGHDPAAGLDSALQVWAGCACSGAPPPCSLPVCACSSRWCAPPLSPRPPP